jgi:hypothetical protein
MSANGIPVADASGTLRPVPSSATASTSNSPHGGSGAVPCTACNVLMKAVTTSHGPPWFGFLPANRGFAKSLAMITRTLPANRGQDSAERCPVWIDPSHGHVRTCGGSDGVRRDRAARLTNCEPSCHGPGSRSPASATLPRRRRPAPIPVSGALRSCHRRCPATQWPNLVRLNSTMARIRRD